jgi:general secretion pathway protein H
MRKVRGFSLIELIAVIVLIAAAAALGAMSMSAGLPGQQLRGATREIAAQMRYTRAQAIVTGKPQLFFVNAESREWTGPNHRHGKVLDIDWLTGQVTTARAEAVP